MSQKINPTAKRKVLLFCALLLACCLLAACQPTPAEPIIVNKNKDLVEEVKSKPSPTAADESHKLRNITLPDGHYTFTSQNEKASLTINVDAEVVKPQADKMPFVRVKPMVFTQQMVTGFFNYLYPEEKPYLPREQLTKGEIEEQLLHLKNTLSKGTVDGDPISEDGIAFYNEQISELEKAYETAPEEMPALIASDGTLQRREITKTDISRDADGELIQTPVEKVLYELNVGLDNAHLFLQYFEDQANPDTNIWYTNTMSNFSTDGMTRIDEDFEIPEAVNKNLSLSLADAIAKADGFFEAAGIEDVMLFASYLVDNHGTGHVDDNWDPASEYAYKLYYTRTVNSIPVGCHASQGASSQDDYTEPWFYESIEFTISDNGILEIHWMSPCAVTEIINEDTDLIDFDTAMDKFQSAVTYTYGNYMDEYGGSETNIDVSIDSIQLNLVRLREKDTAGTFSGLYVPAYVFYGYVKNKTVYEDGYVYEGYMTTAGSGNDFYPGPLMVIAINAIDGSTIDTMKDIY